ncbi:L-aspartate oxidase [Bacillus shivajii]|uniref:L-aspartate oxidase n=1 Tax=Bacillus shivajii TaxID=1983719 RepID=UPI001CF9E578|nr:L-aspartate oxidase [Bacillus shivajii]UCZ54278.1 L-aspartate oxidase [Bacillus shivajii]
MGHDSVIIIGTGMAALVTALKLCNEKNVKLFSKNGIGDGNSWRAQGGIAVAIDHTDYPSNHYEDTLKAGGYHHNLEATMLMVEKGPALLRNWMEMGMEFDRDHRGHLSLGMEGAHNSRRILHAGGDQTGMRCMNFLQRLLPKNVEVIKEQVIDLQVTDGVCDGVVTKKADGNTNTYFAEAIVIATGGCGGIFQHTSNDPNLIGSGLTMAYRAGATLSDLEFLQFHPTVIHKNGKVIGLASEALRGEGARLVDEAGNITMENLHPYGDLAPRDVVARAIHENERLQKKNYLDITRIPKFKERFPHISKMCEEAGIDLKKGRIPVTTGAHFHMGGVVTDIYGRTSIERLYAVGEVARTGVHGTNRLASNSLLETVVFGTQVAEDILRRSSEVACKTKETHQTMKLGKEPDLPAKEDIRQYVSNALGVTRTSATLQGFLTWLENTGLQQWKDASWLNWKIETIERATMITTAWLIARSAMERTESRGAHFRVDFPQRQKKWRNAQLIHEGESLRAKRTKGWKTNDQQMVTS